MTEDMVGEANTKYKIEKNWQEKLKEKKLDQVLGWNLQK